MKSKRMGLAAVACLLIWAFDGETSALIPLYAVGVFSAFTFSQSGMVARWWRTRPPGWRRNLLMNGVGALVTFVVFTVATLTKLDLTKGRLGQMLISTSETVYTRKSDGKVVMKTRGTGVSY